jgi:hypothetical protein
VISPNNAASLIGSYKNEGTHKAININFGDNGLIANWEGDDNFGLQPIFGDYLLSFGRYVFFEIEFNKDKSVNGFYLSYDRMKNLYFKKE